MSNLGSYRSLSAFILPLAVAICFSLRWQVGAADVGLDVLASALRKMGVPLVIHLEYPNVEETSRKNYGMLIDEHALASILEGGRASHEELVKKINSSLGEKGLVALLRKNRVWIVRKGSRCDDLLMASKVHVKVSKSYALSELMLEMSRQTECKIFAGLSSFDPTGTVKMELKPGNYDVGEILEIADIQNSKIRGWLIKSWVSTDNGVSQLSYNIYSMVDGVVFPE